MPVPDLTALVARTEGWPVGLYFAALAETQRQSADPDDRPFRGDDRLLADYIRAVVLDRAAPEQLAFLTRTAFLDELSGPLCDAVLDRSGSASALEDLEAANLLIVPMDRQRNWYRYHHLFQDLLRHELDRLEPGVLPPLAGRASDWCSAEGLVDSAVHYGQVADDVGRVEQIVLHHGMRYYAQGRAIPLESWFTWLADRGSRNGGVAVLGALLNLLSGRPAAARQWTAAAEQAPADLTLPTGVRSPAGWQCCRQHKQRTLSRFVHKPCALCSFSPSAASSARPPQRSSAWQRYR